MSIGRAVDIFMLEDNPKWLITLWEFKLLIPLYFIPLQSHLTQNGLYKDLGVAVVTNQEYILK